MKHKLLIVLGSIWIISYFVITYFVYASTGPTVPLNGRLFWAGAHADIPANWSRDTDFDDKYFQGGSAGFTTSANGGSAAPTHTANSHTHTGNAHTHSFAGAGAVTSSDELVDEVPFSGVFIVDTSEFHIHTHLSETSNASTIVYQSSVPVVSGADEEPPYITVIAIKPDDVNQDIPDDAVCFTDNTDLPTGFEKYAAADDRFLKGAAADGDGGYTAGSSTHSHTSVHTHDINTHSHLSKLCGVGQPAAQSSVSSPQSLILTLSHHQVSLISKSLSDLSSDDGNIQSVNGEPDYVKLLGIQNTSGSARTSLNVIIGYIGTEASIPTGWELVSVITDKQIKSTSIDEDVLTTGGGNSHSHGTSANHGHSHSGTHIHTASERDVGSQAIHNTPDDVYSPTFPAYHTHSWTIGATQPTLGTATFTMSTDDGRFEYRTMIFVRRSPYASIHIKGNTYFKGNILLGGIMIGFGLRRKHG